MNISKDKIILKKIESPKKDWTGKEIMLTDETMLNRRKSVLEKMKERDLDALVIYADLEHAGNFEYLVGFLPRFEEALLVLHSNDEAYLVLGNENLNKASKARLTANAIHCPHFSLPNQPMRTNKTFTEILSEAKLENKKVGVVGWKNFTSQLEDNKKLFDIPMFVLDGLVKLCGYENITNECNIFIGDYGVRTINNPNEIAHYEYGAALASDCMLDALESLDIGIEEKEIADKLVRYGQQTNVVTIVAFGPRFIKANMYPTSKKLEVGDTVSLTVGHKGGLSSRAGYAVECEDQLPIEQRDYISKVCIPYFNSIKTWLENVHVGMTGDEMYKLIDTVLPKSEYHWSLCPGHLTADEEWLSSPIYEGSKETIKSGMLFQTDIIPSVSGYAGVSMESTLCIADNELKKKIKEEYPEMYEGMLNRREYIINVVGIHISEDVLPMCNTLAYMKPLMLSNKAMVVE